MTAQCEINSPVSGITKIDGNERNYKKIKMKFKMPQRAAVFVLIALFAAACVSRSFDSNQELVSKTSDGTAIRGYDAVAYRTIETAAMGKPEYEFVWKGAKWLFVSQENRSRFAANPELYAPEYGGYCAWSISKGNVMEADPKVWKIVDGKLYLIQNEQVKEVWEKSQPDLIEKSNENWQKIKDK